MHDESPTTMPWEAHEPADDRATISSTADPRPTTGADGPLEPMLCPFLRSASGKAGFGTPIASPDPANRCVALREAIPQSLRQQELVCLTSGHVNCPRYLRGSPVVAEPELEPVAGISLGRPAVVASLLVLAAAFLISVAFVVNNGGLVLTASGPSPSPSASEGGLGTTTGGSPLPSATQLPTASPEVTPSPIVTSSPGPTPSPTPASTATPEPTATPQPTSDRYALLTRCPNQSDCYIYVVRSGDNLYSIARYFGVPLATVKAMNPWTQNGLRAGRDLQIPTPTR